MESRCQLLIVVPRFFFKDVNLRDQIRIFVERRRVLDVLSQLEFNLKTFALPREHLPDRDSRTLFDNVLGDLDLEDS